MLAASAWSSSRRKAACTWLWGVWFEALLGSAGSVHIPWEGLLPSCSECFELEREVGPGVSCQRDPLVYADIALGWNVGGVALLFPQGQPPMATPTTVRAIPFSSEELSPYQSPSVSALSGVGNTCMHAPAWSYIRPRRLVLRENFADMFR